jgi:hypothetical protein
MSFQKSTRNASSLVGLHPTIVYDSRRYKKQKNMKTTKRAREHFLKGLNA